MKLLELTPVARLHQRLFTLAYHLHEAELELIAGLPGKLRSESPRWPDRAVLGLDIGAGTGPYGRKLLAHCDQVVLVEPNREQAAYLRRAFGARAHVVETAAGSAAGSALLVDDRGDGWRRPLARLAAAGAGATGWQQVCAVDTMDAMAERLGLLDSSGALIAKIDVEGTELSVLQGMSRLLADRPALLIIEIEARLNSAYAEVFALLAQTGFACYVYKNGRLFPGTADMAAEMAGRSPGRFARLSGYRSNFIFLR